jgi:hypothetical protein
MPVGKYLNFIFTPFNNMKYPLKFNLESSFSKIPFRLNRIIGLLILVHLLLVQQTGLDALMFDAMLLWAMVASLMSIKKSQFRPLLHGNFSIPTGCGILAALLISCTIWGQQELFLRIYPTLVIAGLAAYAGGTSGLRKVLPIIAFCCLIIPTRALLASQTFLAEPTAQLTNHLLALCGLHLDRQHADLKMGEHLVRILPECASVGSMRRMLLLGLWAALIRPTPFIKNLWIPLLTCLYVFIANGLRVAALVGFRVTDNNTT